MNNSKTIPQTGEIENSFKRGYELLISRRDECEDLMKNVREEIMKKCGWRSHMTFYNKMNGSTKLRKPEVEIIQSVFSQFNINPWTGEYFKN